MAVGSPNLPTVFAMLAVASILISPNIDNQLNISESLWRSSFHPELQIDLSDYPRGHEIKPCLIKFSKKLRDSMSFRDLLNRARTQSCLQILFGIRRMNLGVQYS